MAISQSNIRELQRCRLPHFAGSLSVIASDHHGVSAIASPSASANLRFPLYDAPGYEISQPEL
jgi:hypothetical protein